MRARGKRPLVSGPGRPGGPVLREGYVIHPRSRRRVAFGSAGLEITPFYRMVAGLEREAHIRGLSREEARHVSAVDEELHLLRDTGLFAFVEAPVEFHHAAGGHGHVPDYPEHLVRLAGRGAERAGRVLPARYPVRGEVVILEVRVHYHAPGRRRVEGDLAAAGQAYVVDPRPVEPFAQRGVLAVDPVKRVCAGRLERVGRAQPAGVPAYPVHALKPAVVIRRHRPALAYAVDVEPEVIVILFGIDLPVEADRLARLDGHRGIDVGYLAVPHRARRGRVVIVYPRRGYRLARGVIIGAGVHAQVVAELCQLHVVHPAPVGARSEAFVLAVNPVYRVQAGRREGVGYVRPGGVRA